MSITNTESHRRFDQLRVIPVTKPGGGFSFACARTDAEETAAREKAEALGLRAGATMPIEPDPGIWSVIDYLKRR